MVKSRDLRFLGIAEILKLPNPKWLIEDVIQENSLVLLYGEPGSGKSFLALDWSLRIADGEPWLKSHKVMQGISVYVAAEGTAGLRKRLKAYMTNHAKLEAGARFIVVTEPVDLFNGDRVSEFIQAMKEQRDRLGKPVRVIVFDTLARCTPGADENSAKDMGLVVANLDKIRRALDSPAVVVLHHATKNGSSERGSSAIRGAADTIIRQTKTKSQYLIGLACEKQKDSDEFAKISLLARQVPIGEEDERGRPITSLILEHPKEAKGDSSIQPTVSEPESRGLSPKAKQALHALTGDLTRTEWEKASGLPHTTFGNAVRALVKASLVVSPPRGGLYRLTAAQRAA